MLGIGGKKNRQLVGLDIGSSSIKAVELRSTKAGYELVSFGMEALAQDTVVDGAIMDAPQVANAITKIFDVEKVKTKNVATSVSGHSVIVKRVPLPLMTEEELYDRIPSEASQHIPFDIADVNLSYQLLEAMDSQMDVLLVAVKKDKILNHTNVLAQAGKTPVVVDIDAFGLQNCFEVNYEPDAGQTVALLNIGASVMNINIVRGGIPLFTRDVSVGGNQYTDALQKELDLSFDDAERLKNGRHAAERHRRAETTDPAQRLGHFDAGNSEDLRLFPGNGERRKHSTHHGGWRNGASAGPGGFAARRICDAGGRIKSVPESADQSGKTQ